MFNKSGSKVYIVFDFGEEKSIHKKGLQSQENYDDKTNLMESLHSLEDDASGICK